MPIKICVLSSSEGARSRFNSRTTMYKRPTPRNTRPPHTHFVTTTGPSGAQVSYWTPVTSKQVIPSGSYGRVGEIIDKMRMGSDTVLRPPARPWTPPSDYEFIARQLPCDEREAYIKRCEAWFEEHPRAQPTTLRERPVIDTELVAKVFAKYSPHAPPIDVRVAAWRAAGYAEACIAKAVARVRILEETSDERQKALDLIFAKWPAANKTEPKPKGKVIKAVKKRPKA